MYRAVLMISLTILLCRPPAAGAEDLSGWLPELVPIPAGEFLRGSGRPQREAAYQLDEAAYGHSRTRENRWYENEFPYGRSETGAYEITKDLVTNRLYHRFVSETGYSVPDVDPETWKSYGLLHPYDRTRRHAWQNGQFPKGRADHPVVLVSHQDAMAFAEWLSSKTGDQWRLPSEEEWEKAARGIDGRWFPWGITFDPTRLNSHDQGPFDTRPVGQFPMGISPFKVLDMAGQVFEWTGTAARQGRWIVKGGSWDDRGCGVCRAAARHSRPEELKHILIGFRLVRMPS